MALLVAGVSGQIDDICAEAGITPSLDSPFAHVPYLYGRISLKGFDSAKLPRVTVSFTDGQTTVRWTVGRTGNYCFRRRSAGGSIIVEVDGIEAARRSLPSFGSDQQREDFEIFKAEPSRQPASTSVSAKFLHQRSDKTEDLYKKAAESEAEKDLKKAAAYLRQIVEIDPADFIAWAKLGSVNFALNALPEADAAFRRSLELRVDYTPAWINAGQLRMAQKQFDTAIEIFKHASTLEPGSARIYQLLGEAYLQARQGTLGAQALNKAIDLDPIGMAECHLQLAHLYQLAKANALAAREYRLFLEKVPEHPEKKKLEKFIKDNPEGQ